MLLLVIFMRNIGGRDCIAALLINLSLNSAQCSDSQDQEPTNELYKNINS